MALPLKLSSNVVEGILYFRSLIWLFEHSFPQTVSGGVQAIVSNTLMSGKLSSSQVTYLFLISGYII